MMAITQSEQNMLQLDGIEHLRFSLDQQNTLKQLICGVSAVLLENSSQIELYSLETAR